MTMQISDQSVSILRTDGACETKQTRVKTQNDVSDSGEFFAAGPISDAIRKLARAYQYSVDCDRSKWDFAVEINDLDSLGVSHDELRWMIGKELVEHAQEIAGGHSTCRTFDAPGGFTFSQRSCFVVTKQGLELAVDLTLDAPNQLPGVDGVLQQVARATRPANQILKPSWDDQRHELWLGNVLIKRFKWRASNQESVLTAFQEDGWPAHIDDPLSPVPETDPKRRLSDTIKCLNRKQQSSLIRFSGMAPARACCGTLSSHRPNNRYLGQAIVACPCIAVTISNRYGVASVLNWWTPFFLLENETCFWTKSKSKSLVDAAAMAA